MIEPAYQQNRLHICGQDERIEKRGETVKLVKNTFKAFAKFVNVTYEKFIFQQNRLKRLETHFMQHHL